MNIRILIAEDCEINQLHLRMILDKKGISYDLVENGEQAVAKLDTETYDILLLDWHLPHIHGKEVLAYARNERKLTIPVVILSADIGEPDKSQFSDLGITDWMLKPVDEHLLLELISRLTHPQPMDLDHLRAKTSNNPAQLKSLIQVYLVELPKLAAALSKSMDEKDWDTLFIAAHRLTPALTTLRAAPEFKIMLNGITEHASLRCEGPYVRQWTEKIVTFIAEACRTLETEQQDLE